MAISGDYPHPVTVNGFTCHNCTDVDRAKRGIDPAKPAAGPYGVNEHKAAKASPQHIAGALRDPAFIAALDTLTASGAPLAGGGPPGQLVSIKV